MPYRNSDIALGEVRNFGPRGTSVPHVKGRRQRDMAARYCVVNLLRTAKFWEAGI